MLVHLAKCHLTSGYFSLYISCSKLSIFLHIKLKLSEINNVLHIDNFLNCKKNIYFSCVVTWLSPFLHKINKCTIVYFFDNFL